MEHVLARAELLVKRQRGIVAVVALDEDHPGAALARDPAQRGDQGRGDALPPPGLGNREVVDVDLAARLFELLQLVGDQPADDIVPVEGDENADMRLGQQAPQVRIVRRRALEGLAFVEGLAEQPVERADLRELVRSELRDAQGQIATAVPLTLTISIEPLLPSTS